MVPNLIRDQFWNDHKIIAKSWSDLRSDLFYLILDLIKDQIWLIWSNHLSLIVIGIVEGCWIWARLRTVVGQFLQGQSGPGKGSGQGCECKRPPGPSGEQGRLLPGLLRAGSSPSKQVCFDMEVWSGVPLNCPTAWKRLIPYLSIAVIFVGSCGPVSWISMEIMTTLMKLTASCF